MSETEGSELMAVMGRHRHMFAVLYVLGSAVLAWFVVEHSVFALGLIRTVALYGAEDMDNEPDVWTVVGIAVFVAVEAVFMLGVGRLTTRQRTGGRPMLFAVLGIGSVAVLAIAGSLLFTAVELVDRGGGDDSVRSTATANSMGSVCVVYLIAFVVVVWLIWGATVALALRRGGRGGAVRRAVWTLLAGSWFNVIAALGVDAGIRRQHKDYCYCTQGTYFSLLVGIPLLLLAIGPAIVLIYRHHRLDPAAARRLLKARTRRTP